MSHRTRKSTVRALAGTALSLTARLDRAAVALQGGVQAARCDVPDLHEPFEVAGGEQLAIGGEGQPVGVAAGELVPLQGGGLAAGGGLEEFHRAELGAGGQGLAVGREGDCAHLADNFQLGPGLARAEVP